MTEDVSKVFSEWYVGLLKVADMEDLVQHLRLFKVADMRELALNEMAKFAKTLKEWEIIFQCSEKGSALETLAYEEMNKIIESERRQK